MQKMGSFFVAIMINYLSMASSDQCALLYEGLETYNPLRLEPLLVIILVIHTFKYHQ